MISNIEERSIRVLPFSGKSSDWKIWSRKFLAGSNRKGYKNLLFDKDAIPNELQYTLLGREIHSNLRWHSGMCDLSLGGGPRFDPQAGDQFKELVTLVKSMVPS